MPANIKCFCNNELKKNSLIISTSFNIKFFFQNFRLLNYSNKMAQIPQMPMCGGTGQEKPATPEIQEMVDNVQ